MSPEDDSEWSAPFWERWDFDSASMTLEIFPNILQ
jgi:hypothetical protein